VQRVEDYALDRRRQLAVDKIARGAQELFEKQGIAAGARTDLLAPNDRRAIEAASILGQRFTLANLRALIEDPRYACDALLRNALLRCMSRRRTRRYRRGKVPSSPGSERRCAPSPRRRRVRRILRNV
jgi:hypothetical protein